MVKPFNILHRSTPVETLHTILLGPYKYLLKVTIPTLNATQKQEILARMTAFNYSGFDGRVLGNVVHRHKSFVGRDYKAWAQMALFILGPYLSHAQQRVWLGLSKVCFNFQTVFSIYAYLCVCASVCVCLCMHMCVCRGRGDPK